MDTDYLLLGSFGRTRPVDPARPSAYIVETYFGGRRESRMVFGPDEFEVAYRLYAVLTDSAYLAGLSPEAVQWTVQY